MKRFYSILSLLLLFLAGASNVAAQEFSEGTLLTSIDAVAKEARFILKSPGTSDDHPSGYVCGTKQYKQNIDKSCLFTLEAVTGETVDGYQVYLLKQVETGLYFKDYELGGEFWDSSDLPPFSNGDLTEMTDNKAQAMKFTVLRFEDLTGQTVVQSRTSATNAKQDLSQDGFVFTRADVSSPCPENNPYTYLGGLGKPFYSRYVDTNVHQIYTVNEKTGYEKIRAYAMAYFPGSPETAFPPGVDPGYYPANLVAEAQKIYDNVGAWQESGLPEELRTEEAVNAYCARIVELAELLAKSIIKVETGYYFIRDSRETPRYWRPVVQDNKQLLGWSAYTVPEVLDVESARHIWKVTKSSVKNATTGENDDVYTFQSYFTNEFASATTTSGDRFTMAAEPANFTIDKEAALAAQTGSFVIYPYGKSGQKMNTYNNGAIGIWAWTDAGNCFRFQTVDESAVADLEETIRQAALNEKLQTLLTDAQTLKRKNDGSIGMVTNVSQLSGNENDPSEGQLANLIDGNSTSFYHSSWRDAQKDGVLAYVQADLGIAVSKINLDYTRRWRRVNPIGDNPLTAIVSGTNTPDDEESWQYLADITFDYVDEVRYANQSTQGTDTLVAESRGVTPVDFNGNYRYIRLSVTSVVQPGGANTSTSDPFWCLAELYFKSDATPNYSMLDEELRTRFEALMAQAATELEAGAAKQETIDALTAAYNAVLASIPDPIRIANAVAEAKALRAKAQAGTEPGYFSYDAIAKFDAAIATANDAVKAGITLAEIESVIAALDAATVEFNGALILPTVGSHYVIRSASTKKAWTNDHWNSARAPLASVSNAASAALKITYLDGSHITEEGAPLTPIEELVDTADVYQDMRNIWLVEEAGEGKIVLRNVGTGMYLSEGQTENSSGQAYQSAEKSSVTYYLAGPGKFVFVAGLVSGNETYFNCNSAGSVVTWNAKDDENGFWSFEAVDPVSVEAPYYYLSLAPGRMHIVTLPVDVIGGSCYYGDYVLVGQSADNKLVLTPGSNYNDGIIPAGVPFIVTVPADAPNGTQNFQMEYILEDGETYMDGTVKYVFEPVKVAGLQGTLCETAVAGVGCAVLNASGIQAIKTGNVTVGVNSGYFDGTQTLDVVAGDGDITLDIPENFVLNSINDAIVLKGENNNVYSVSGVLVRKNVKGDAAVKGLPAGLYIVNGEKVVVK